MRQTNKGRIADYDRVASELSTLQLALHLAVTTSPDAVQTFYEPTDGFKDCKHVYALYGALRASGGLVIATFHNPDQSPSAQCIGYLDNVKTSVGSDLETLRAIAIERLKVARARLLSAEDDKRTLTRIADQAVASYR